MTWKVIQATAAGTAHLERGEPCQDDCTAAVLPLPGGEALVAFAADGAGSASHGGLGAAAACAAAQAVARDWLERAGSPDGLTADVLTGWAESVRQCLYDLAAGEGLALRDFACTLLGAVVGPGSAGFLQVGDGAIVRGDGGGFAPVFWPESGEYANATYFLTDDRALSRLRVEVGPAADEVALLTDGLQRLALVYESRTAHAPFFEPMFRVLRAAAPGACASLAPQLAEFLGSRPVNERTDDDKTLVLATRRASG